MAKRQQPRVYFIAKYVTAATLTILPWLVYAKLAFGFAVPSSDRLNIDAAWESFASGGPGLWTSAYVTAEYLNACARFALGLASSFWPASHQYDRLGLVLVPFLALSGITWLIARTARRVGSQSTVMEPVAYTLAVFCVVIAATAVIPIALSKDMADLYYRRWYIVELPILVAVLGGIGTEVVAAFVMRPSPAVVRVLLTAGLVTSRLAPTTASQFGRSRRAIRGGPLSALVASMAPLPWLRFSTGLFRRGQKRGPQAMAPQG